MLLTFTHMLEQSFRTLSANNLCELHAFALPFLRLGITCTPMIFDRSVIFTKVMTFMYIVALEQPPMLLAVNALLVTPALLLGFLGNAGVN